MGAQGYMALQEYDPGAAVRGVIGRATDESSLAMGVSGLAGRSRWGGR